MARESPGVHNIIRNGVYLPGGEPAYITFKLKYQQCMALSAKQKNRKLLNINLPDDVKMSEYQIARHQQINRD